MSLKYDVMALGLPSTLNNRVRAWPSSDEQFVRGYRAGECGLLVWRMRGARFNAIS